MLPAVLATRRATAPLEQQIKRLFAAHDPWLRFEPWSLSTLFQDTFGLIPVTDVGQPVGLILSKDYSPANLSGLLSLDLYEGNGATTIAATGNTITLINALATDGIKDNSVFTTGKGYIAFADVTVSGSGSITVYAGGTPKTITLTGDPVTHRCATVNNSSGWLIIRGGSGGTNGTVVINKVAEITKCAYQTTATARPILRKDENGFYYLESDGVDDSLITPILGFTGTVATLTAHQQTSGTIWVALWLANHSANGYWAVAQAANASAPNQASGVGSPTYTVNGIALSPITRGEMYSRTFNKKTVVTTRNLTLIGDYWKIGGYPAAFLNGRLYGVIINNDMTDKQEAICRKYLNKNIGI